MNQLPHGSFPACLYVSPDQGQTWTCQGSSSVIEVPDWDPGEYVYVQVADDIAARIERGE